uniref:RF_PROK_I domain-containing protein n=1 Tax=Meloidogyne hapla TaxID=6305 RepID=A0A1I8AX05_MELHA
MFRFHHFSSIRFSSNSTAKRLLKNYKFPEILPKDCEEQYIRGWGPGGSCVNSSSNAVLLKHKPTGCFVKIEVDKHLNGENSYFTQFESIKSEIEEKTKKSSQRKRQIMAELKTKGEIVLELNEKKSWIIKRKDKKN